MGEIYLNENLETVAGHGCAIKTSLRGKIESCLELTFMDILATSEGTARFSRMSSNICKMITIKN